MKKRLLLLPTMLIGLCLGNVNANDLSHYKNIIPAYWWNYNLNKDLLKLNQNSSIVIVNPSNGDFNNSEDVFKDEINKTHQNNNLAIWYFYTKYGRRNKGDVKNVINKRLEYYPNIDGFFIDETADTKDKLNYYKEIYNYIKQKNPSLVVVLNPWTTPDKWYFDISDDVVVYENSCKDYENYKMPEWLKSYKNKISFLWYSCSKDQYNNLKNKYWDYQYYFTNDWDDWNPWDSLSKYLLEDSNNIKYNKEDNNEEKDVSYSFKKFHNILDVAKLTYPDGNTLIRRDWDYKWYKSDFFYATKEGNMVFYVKKAKDEYKKRCELRQRVNWKDTGWNISENKIHELKAKVKLQKLSWTNWEEYTFMQIHSEEHPLLRMAVRKDKNGKKDHIWAIIRITTKDSGRITQRYDLWEVNENKFDSFTIRVWNNRLIILRDGKEYVNKDISYWTETKNYFKAWIYLSHDNHLSYNVKVLFNELTATSTQTDTENNTNNTDNTNNKTTTDDKQLYKQITEFVKNSGKQQTIYSFWKEKIKNLEFKELNLDLWNYSKYYDLFKKFFNIKKEKILNEWKQINEDYYNYLKSFNSYTNWLFTDIYYKNYKNIKNYIKWFEKVAKKLRKVK